MVAGSRNSRLIDATVMTLALVVLNLIYSLAATGSALAYLQQSSRGFAQRFVVTDARSLDPLVIAGIAAGDAATAPALGAASALPVIGADVGVVRFAARAAEAGVRSTRATAEELGSIAGGSSIARAVYANGRLDFEKIARLREIAGVLNDDLASLLEESRALPTATLRPVEKAQNKITKLLATAVGSLEKASVLLSIVPNLAGQQEAKRYLLAFQSPSEARGSGGIIGVYAVLRADAGTIHLDHVGPIAELNDRLKRPVDAPRWFVDLYGRLQALEEMRHANLALHFPTVAAVLLEMYEQATGETLDGAMTLDPIVLEQMTRATGALTGPGWDVRVGPRNARRVLLHDSYLKFGQYRSKAQNRFLRGVIDDLLQRLNGGRLDAAVMAESLVRSAKWQHLKLYASDPGIQTRLGRLGISGDPTTAPGHVQGVFHNNFTGSKIDYFLHREVATNVALEEGGDATVTTTVRLHNDAPTSPSSLLIRPLRRRFPNGHNRMTLNILMPEDARLISFSKDGRRAPPLRGNEAGLPVVWDVVDIPAGEDVTIEVTYALDGAASAGSFDLTLWPQALVRPDDFVVTVDLPEGTDAELTPARRFRADGTYSLEGRLFGPKTVSVRLND